MRANDRGDAREASFRLAVSLTHARTYVIVPDRAVVAEMRIRTVEMIFIIRCH